MQFVWFYVPGPENGFELRHSIRSVKQNFVGDSHITVIGDRPEWYTGHMISVPKVKPRLRHRHDRDAFLDTQNKAVVASMHQEIQDEFVWLADDNFLLRPTTIEELQVPRFDPWWKPTTRKEWHRLIVVTLKALQNHQKSVLQYGTHLPHHIEKQKLAELFRIYDYPRHLFLWEILYANHWKTGGVPYGGTPWQGVQYPHFLRRLLKRPRNAAELDAIAQVSSVLNYQSGCFGPVMKNWLARRFPTKAECEI